MQYTIENLMQAVGCPKWPERWHEIFDDAMAEYDRNGCKLAEPEFHRSLHEKYQCYPVELETFMEVAAETAKDEALARFLTLLSMAVQDRGQIHKEAKQIGQPVAPEGKSQMAYDMVLALAFAATAEYTDRALRERGLPEETVLNFLQMPSKCVQLFREKNGRPGYGGIFWWDQLYVDGFLHKFGCLTLDISGGREGSACVYVNELGERAILTDGLRIHKSGRPLGCAGCTDEEGAWLAEITETEDAYIGYPVLPDGSTYQTQLKLLKCRWKQILGRDDPVLRLHIPSGVKFDPHSVDEALQSICRFLEQYYPEIKTRIFSCNSWMLDPQLKKMLSENSNIIAYQNRFQKMPRVSAGRGVLHFVFGKPSSEPVDLDALPQNSSLQAKLISHYKSGNYIYETAGFFLYDPTQRKSFSDAHYKKAREGLDFPVRVKDMTKLEGSIRKFESQPIVPGKILFYGDSNFTRWVARWGHRPMEEDLAAKDGSLAVVNHGFGTSTAEELLYYYDRAVRPWQPRALVLQVFGNDIGAGYTPEEILALLQRLCDCARKDFPGIRLYLGNYRPVKREIGNSEFQNKILHFHQLLAEYCAENPDCTLIDQLNDPIFYNDPEDAGNPDKIRTDVFVSDNNHFNQVGYDLYREFYREALKDLL